MIRHAAYVLCIATLVIASCKKDEGKDESLAQGSTAKEESITPPAVVTDPTAGSSAGVDEVDPVDMGDDGASDDGAGGSAPSPVDTTPLNDLRPDVSQTFALPTSLQTIDPRTFTPSGTFTPGRGKLNLDFTNSNVLVPPDGRTHLYAACPYPFAAPGHAQFSVTVDGNTSEWPAASVVGIDRAGDGPHGSSMLDVRAVQWTEDATYYYMAFEMGANWQTTGMSNNDSLEIIFRKLNVPADTTTNPDVSYADGEYLRLVIRNTTLSVIAHDNSVTAVNSGDYQLAAAGKFIELKLQKANVTAKTGSSPFVVLVDAWKFNGTWKHDKVGPHIVGLTDDYACMVPLPDANGAYNRAKMVVMTRTSGVTASNAENVYRSLVAAMPEASYTAGDDFDTFDSFNLVAIQAMSAAGICGYNFGIMMEDDINDRLGTLGTPYYNFWVASHEYLHNFNATDYALPNSWMIEGHSDWMAGKTMKSYYGANPFILKSGSDMRKFQQEEATNGVQTIADSSWGSAPYTALFYYNKSSTFWDLISDRVTYTDLLENIYKKAQTATAFADTSAVLTAIKGLASYTGLAGDDLTSGWFGGDYASSVFPASKVQDADGDGLPAYLEARLGTDPTKADTDADGYSDLFEWQQGMNPTVAQTITKLAPDNLLADWDKLAPTKLKTITSHLNTSTCAVNLKRHGVGYSNGWLFVGAELTGVPAAGTNYKIVLFMYEPNRTDYQMQLIAGRDYVMPSSAGSEVFRPVPLAAPYVGKEYELAYNFSWLGWSAFPAGTTYKIGLIVNNATWCDFVQTQSIEPLF